MSRAAARHHCDASCRGFRARSDRYPARHAPAPPRVLRRARIAGRGAALPSRTGRSRDLRNRALGVASCGGKLQCATLTVPVDYSQPDGEQVGIAVARLRATQPAERIGSLVFNFGGPGDAGSETLRRVRRADPGRDPGAVRPRELRSAGHRQVAAGRVRRRRHRRPARTRSIPPRTPTPTCARSTTAPTSPSTSSSVASRATARGWRSSAAATWPATSIGCVPRSATTRCRSSGTPYGTVIGAVYAQMFPDRVGRMVLDSPVDLSADALEELRGNSKGFEQALDDFLADCAANRSCPVPQQWRSHRRARHARAAVRAGLELPTVDLATGAKSKRKAGVAAFYIALDLRALRPAVRLARARQRAQRRPRRRRQLPARAGRPLQRPSRRRQLRQHRRGHRRDPLRRPRRPGALVRGVPGGVRPRVAQYPLLGRLRGEHARSAAIPDSPAARHRAAGRRPRRPAAPILVVGTTARSGDPVRRRRGPGDPARPVRGCSRSTAPSTPRTPRTRASTAPSTRTCCAGRCRPKAPLCKA